MSTENSKKDMEALYAKRDAEANRNANEQHQKSLSGGSSTGCFVPETLVLTPSGWTQISEIQAGKNVLSYDLQNKILETKIVIAKRKYSRRAIWSIQSECSKKAIKTTKLHPFMTQNGWKSAAQLEPGDYLTDIDQNGLPIKNRVLSIDETDECVDVFNLITYGHHNFIVKGALVHNFGGFKGLRSALSDIIFELRTSILASTAVPKPLMTDM